jgi:hypothetical protein
MYTDEMKIKGTTIGATLLILWGIWFWQDTVTQQENKDKATIDYISWCEDLNKELPKLYVDCTP